MISHLVFETFCLPDFFFYYSGYMRFGFVTYKVAYGKFETFCMSAGSGTTLISSAENLVGINVNTTKTKINF